MRITPMLTVKLAATTLVALAAALSPQDARGDAPREVTPSGTGFQSVYGQLPADQAEFLSTPQAIQSAVLNAAPSAVWEVLEHGEKVECLDCIPNVANLLYDSNASTREIAAWWLRRRVFGVFGPGEVYESTVTTLQSDPSPLRRSYAAYALGELFASPGITACATAVVSDADPGVRAAAASALGRLNSDGQGALATALADSDPGVKLAALQSATRINAFSGRESIASLITDANVAVRRRAIETLEALNVKDAVAAVATAAQNDPDAGVRAEACHALGALGDASALPVVQQLAASDPNGLVRDQAQIAVQRL